MMELWRDLKERMVRLRELTRESSTLGGGWQTRHGKTDRLWAMRADDVGVDLDRAGGDVGGAGVDDDERMGLLWSAAEVSAAFSTVRTKMLTPWSRWRVVWSVEVHDGQVCTLGCPVNVLESIDE